jgi:hypothetical protein
MKSFNTFFEEAADVPQQEPQRLSEDAVAIFGRHQPPHLGHKLTLDRAHDIAGSIGDKSPADQIFYSSRSQDPKKNPLPYQLKMNFIKKMFPEHAEKWDDDENIRTILGAATKAHERGYKNFHFVGGADRRQPMEDLLRRYNGDLYNFDNIYSHSVGERGDQNRGKTGMLEKLSASKMRKFAFDNDFNSFLSNSLVGDTFKEQDAKQLFDAIRMFSQVQEDWEIDPREHQEYIREIYREGELFTEGDIVEHLTTGLIGEVHRCGTNHIIALTSDGIMFKSFLHDLQLY